MSTLVGTLASLGIHLDVDSSKVKGGLHGARTEIKSFMSESKSHLGVVDKSLDTTKSHTEGLHSGIRGMLGSMLKFAGGMYLLNKVGSAFSGMKDAVVGLNARLETATLQFTNLLGSADAAREHVKMLFRFAELTPFEAEPVIQASRYMRIFGGATLDTLQNLTLFGDAAAITGNSISDVSFQMSRAYANIQDGRPIGRAALALMQMGVISPHVVSEVQKLQKSGASATEVWNAFSGSLTRFHGGMIMTARTWSGLMSTFKDSVAITAANSFQPFFVMAKKGLTELITIMNDPRFEKGAEIFANVISTSVTSAVKYLGLAIHVTWMFLQPFIAAIEKSVHLFRQSKNVSTDLAGGFMGLAESMGASKKTALAVADVFRHLGDGLSALANWGKNVGYPLFKKYLHDTWHEIGDIVGWAFRELSKLLDYLDNHKDTARKVGEGVKILAAAILAILAANKAAGIINDVFSAIGAVPKTLSNTVSDLKTLGSSLKDIAENGAKVAGKTFNFTVSATQNVASAAQTATGAAASGAATAGQWVAGFAGSVGGFIATAFTKIPWAIVGGAILGGLATVGEIVAAGIAIIFSPPVLIAAAVIAAVLLIYTFRDNIWKFIKEIPGYIASGIGWLLAQFVNIAVTLIGGLVSGLVAGWEGVTEFFGKIPGWIAEKFNTAKDWLFGTGADIFTGLKNGAMNIWLVFTNWIASIPGEIKKFFKDPWKYLLKVGGNIFDGLKKGLEIGWNVIKWFFLDLPGKIEGFFKGAGDWLWDVGGKLLGGLWDGIKGAFGWFWGLLSGFFGGIRDSFFNNLSDAGKDAINGLHDGITSTWDSVSTWFKDLPNKIWGFVTSAGTWLLQSGKDLLWGLWHGISYVWDRVSGWFTGLPGTIGKAIIGIGEWLRQAGRDLIWGLWHGITDVAGRVVQGVKDFGSDVVNGLKGILGIHSPSKVFHNIGMQTMIGLHNGLKLGHPKVQKFISGMAVDFGKAADINVSKVVSGEVNVHSARVGDSITKAMKKNRNHPEMRMAAEASRDRKEQVKILKDIAKRGKQGGGVIRPNPILR